jgi:hypothetical protein
MAYFNAGVIMPEAMNVAAAPSMKTALAGGSFKISPPA